MAETQKILQNYPFNLEVDQAFLFARYIIEDCYEDYVYCDGLNENVRDVVKSIVNAVIGQYKKPSSLMKVEAKEFLVSHRQYLSAALRSSCTGGKVRKSTFLDILSHLEISMS
jgi:RNase adaptor protein for sRNA GlmZ degradation